MFYNDHQPPHFHAVYGEHRVTVSIDPVEVLQGNLPCRARATVLEWATMHRGSSLTTGVAPVTTHRCGPSSRSTSEGVSMHIVVEVKVLKPYVLAVSFADGAHRRVDVEPLLHGEMFEPLCDPAVFAQATVDPVLGTVVWPNGADLSPEYLYDAETEAVGDREGQG